VLVRVSDLVPNIYQGAIASPLKVAISERKNSLHQSTVLRSFVMSPMEGSVNAVMIATSCILGVLGDRYGVTLIVA
jgi:hypothetical protein